MSDYQFTYNFSGSYELLEFILKKYGIYESKVTNLFEKYNYVGDSKRKDSPSGDKSKWWRYSGVPNRVWNLLHKDLSILNTSGNIKYTDLQTLKKEYESK